MWIGGGGNGGSGEYDCVHHTASCTFSMVIYALYTRYIRVIESAFRKLRFGGACDF